MDNRTGIISGSRPTGEFETRTARTDLFGCLNELFSTKGAFDSEIAIVVEAFRSGQLDPESTDFDKDGIDRWEYLHKKNFKFDVLPMLQGLSRKAAREQLEKLSMEQNTAKLEEIAGRGQVILPDHGNCKAIRQNLDGVNRLAGKWGLSCIRCGERMLLLELVLQAASNGKKMKVLAK